MQQAIPYKSWPPIYATPATLSRQSSLVTTTTVTHTNPTTINVNGSKAKVTDMVSESAVMVFVRRGCCMGHVVKHLLLGHGVNPSVCEVDEKDEAFVAKQLGSIGAAEGEGDESLSSRPSTVQFPAVFIGGRLFGGLDRVMAAHITGELVPLLKEAGALWL
ncbi:hypothetical protein FNV43_RR13748 [Rhamnella rubrinervis]|uniref:Glutaredoxin domain-containing protein n=1 Tax=Rhamnella rubrinervis TaxID=2594499 RepID=A0A8K0H1Y5_9ROSA|nr:hypothetical protein FNV43_RR13748 [Rhamnella rubrinervis]